MARLRLSQSAQMRFMKVSFIVSDSFKDVYHIWRQLCIRSSSLWLNGAGPPGVCHWVFAMLQQKFFIAHGNNWIAGCDIREKSSKNITVILLWSQIKKMLFAMYHYQYCGNKVQMLKNLWVPHPTLSNKKKEAGFSILIFATRRLGRRLSRGHRDLISN